MKTLTCAANDFGDHIKNELGFPMDLDSSLHKGFTVGKGKKMYWYFFWHKTGNATIYDTSYPLNKRFIKGDQLITIHFKD